MITAKNYAAQVIRDIVAIIPKVDASAKVDLIGCLDKLKTSVHFVLPDDGILLDDDFVGLTPENCRLPYPCISVEWFDSTLKQKYLVLANEGPYLGEITTTGFAEDKVTKEWFPILCSIIVDTTTIRPSPMRVDQRVSKFCQSILNKQTGPDAPVERQHKKLIRMMMSVLALIEALSCRNVGIAIHQVASPVNTKRMKAGKLPIYETKTLVIDTRSEKSNKSGAVGTKEHTGTRQKQHIRRGHIRHLKTHNTWIDDYKAGDPTLGIIDKQYKVK